MTSRRGTGKVKIHVKIWMIKDVTKVFVPGLTNNRRKIDAPMAVAPSFQYSQSLLIISPVLVVDSFISRSHFSELRAPWLDDAERRDQSSTEWR